MSDILIMYTQQVGSQKNLSIFKFKNGLASYTFLVLLEVKIENS